MKLSKRLRSMMKFKAAKSLSDYNFDDYHKILLEGMKKPVVFDVGANEGQSIKRFRSIFPDAIIHSFEPDKENFELISGNFRGEWLHLNNLALAEVEGNMIFNRMAKSTLSSLNKMRTDTEFVKIKSAQFDTIPDKFVTESYEVCVTTLGKYAHGKNIDRINLLKVDTQAYEDKVLEGARDLLSQRSIDVLELEIIFEDIYDRQLTFLDIESILLPYGYQLFALGSKTGQYPSRFNRLAFQIIALYLSKDMIDKFRHFKLDGVE